jgi:hypothetical protein
MQIAESEGKDWTRELNTFLLAYRTTPHTTTGISPAEAFLNRKVQCKLPPSGATSIPLTLDGQMREKQKGKFRGDQGAGKDQIRIGDRVWVRQRKRNKLSTNFETEPYEEVIQRTGCILVVKKGIKIMRRHSTQSLRIQKYKRCPTIRRETLRD